MNRCEDSCIVGYRLNPTNIRGHVSFSEYSTMDASQELMVCKFVFCPYCGTPINDLIEEYNYDKKLKDKINE